MNETRSRWRTVVRLAPTVLSAMGLSVLGLVIVRALVPASTLARTNDVVGNYLQTLGTVDAVLLAFVVFVVWTQFDAARNQTASEANEVLDVYRTARGLPERVRVPLQDAMRRYVDAVLAEEWRAMNYDDARVIERAAQILDEGWQALQSFEHGSECHFTLYAEALSRFNDLSDRRTARLVSARTRIPFAMRLLLYTGAVIVVGSMWLFGVESLSVHVIMTAALAGAISHILYLVDDLDACFEGEWHVSRGPFERVQEIMRQRRQV